MTIKLPQPHCSNSINIESALRQRETKREFLKSALSLQNLSLLLFSAQGKRGDGKKRTAPSAQEQYPIAVFIVAINVLEIEAGIYRYNPSDHSIQLIAEGKFAQTLNEAAIGDQPWVDEAAAIIVLAANIESMKRHFSSQAPRNQRGERYVYIETGAIAQNVQLLGTSLEIGMVLLGGFDDALVKSSLNLPSTLEPTALLCVGNV